MLWIKLEEKKSAGPQVSRTNCVLLGTFLSRTIAMPRGLSLWWMSGKFHWQIINELLIIYFTFKVCYGEKHLQRIYFHTNPMNCLKISKRFNRTAINMSKNRRGKMLLKPWYFFTTWRKPNGQIDCRKKILMRDLGGAIKVHKVHQKNWKNQFLH